LVLFGALRACCNASRKEVRPTDPLKPSWDLAVIQMGMVTTSQMNANIPM
jgi:hypothetical protein